MADEVLRLKGVVAELERRLAEAHSDARSAVEVCCPTCRGQVSRVLGVSEGTLSRVSAEALEMLALFDYDASGANDESIMHTLSELEVDPFARFSRSQKVWSQQRVSSRGPPSSAALSWRYVVVALVSQWLSPRDCRALACCSAELRDHCRGLRADGKRFQLAAALRRNETSYLRALRLAFALAGPLRDLTGGASHVLFDSFPVLMQISTKLLGELGERLSFWERSTTLGDAFVALGPALKLYGQYVTQYATINSAYSAFLKSDKVRAVLHEAERSTGVMPLGVLLAQANGRVAHYVDALKQLIRATDDKDADSPLLIAALKTVSGAAFAMMDEEPRSNHAVLFLKQCKGIPAPVLNRVVNFEWTGTFYWTRKKLGAKPKDKEVKLLLFQDFVLLVLRNSGGWKFLCSFAIGACSASRDGFSLTLSSTAPLSPLSVVVCGATADTVEYVAAKIPAMAAVRRNVEVDMSVEAAVWELTRSTKSRSNSISVSPKMGLRKEKDKEGGGLTTSGSGNSPLSRSPNADRKKDLMSGPQTSSAMASPGSPRSGGSKLSPRFKARPLTPVASLPSAPEKDCILSIELVSCLSSGSNLICFLFSFVCATQPPDYSAIALSFPAGSTFAAVLHKACEMRNLAPAEYRLYDLQRNCFVQNLAAAISGDLRLKLRSGPPAVPRELPSLVLIFLFAHMFFFCFFCSYAGLHGDSRGLGLSQHLRVIHDLTFENTRSSVKKILESQHAQMVSV